MSRDTLLPNFSLGWELEATDRAQRPLKGVEMDHDGSVNGDALEYRASKRIVFDPQKSLEALRHLATDPFLKTDASCGFHVHIGLGKRSRRIHQWAAAFVTLARHVESEAFEAVPGSRASSSYCRKWAQSRESIIQKEYVRNKHSCPDRYNWINPVEIFRPGGIRTIEIRLMGDTHRYPYLLAWVAFCRLMAMSAWAVSIDISREQQEIDSLKMVLRTIRDMFCRVVDSKVIARNTIALAYRARLIHPYGNPLSFLFVKEDQLHLAAILDERERDQYNNMITEMRRSIQRNVERIAESPELRDAVFQEGDTVECLRVPVDGGARRGNLYRVISFEPQLPEGLQIINENGRAWYVRAIDFRLTDRIREEGLTISVA